MPGSVPQLSLTRHLAALGVGACLLLGGAASAAQAATAGILPPRNPAANCDRGGGLANDGVAGIDACRALENVGPLELPSNWNALTTVEQGFVLLDLERVNRGLSPIVGLSPALNALASSGAANDTDPSFPAGGFIGGGAIWAEVPSVLTADQLWMYDDGVGGNNADCGASGDRSCWGHRDIILWDKTHGALVAGGGYSNTGGTGSFAYVVLAGYSTANLSFSWASELKYFAKKPAVEPLGKAASVRKRHRQAGHRKSRRRPQRVQAASSDPGPTITIG